MEKSVILCGGYGCTYTEKPLRCYAHAYTYSLLLYHSLLDDIEKRDESKFKTESFHLYFSLKEDKYFRQIVKLNHFFNIALALHGVLLLSHLEV